MPSHQAQLPMGEQRFNHYDKKYQACCNNGHALNVAKAICVVELAMALLAAAYTGGGVVFGFIGVEVRATHYSVYVITALCCSVTLVGLYKHNKHGVLAGVIYHAVLGVAATVGGIYIIAKGIAEANEIDEIYKAYSDLLVKRYLLMFGSTLALCIAVYAWLCLVHVSAYRYLRDAWRAGVRPLGHADSELVYASGGVLAYNYGQQSTAAGMQTTVRATTFEQAEQSPKY